MAFFHSQSTNPPGVSTSESPFDFFLSGHFLERLRDWYQIQETGCPKTCGSWMQIPCYNMAIGYGHLQAGFSRVYWNFDLTENLR